LKGEAPCHSAIRQGKPAQAALLPNRIRTTVWPRTREGAGAFSFRPHAK
jgi:hypothetical protein